MLRLERKLLLEDEKILGGSCTTNINIFSRELILIWIALIGELNLRRCYAILRALGLSVNQNAVKFALEAYILSLCFADACVYCLIPINLLINLLKLNLTLAVLNRTQQRIFFRKNLDEFA